LNFTGIKFRLARKKDIPRLNTIEQQCFDGDRLSRRSFQWIIENGHAELLCLEKDGIIAGYGLLFYRRGTTLARLYSFAIAPEFQGQGLSKPLMMELELIALKDNKSAIRLEVRDDNFGAIGLYESLGYKRFKVKLDYYEDHAQALCYQKKIIKPGKHLKLKVPYYRQTTDFTCGPASLLMAMAALDKKISMSQNHELDLWREATTIFMLSGHGGCGPRGLALAAYRRGFEVELHLSTKEGMFLDSVRSEKKKAVLKLVHEDFKLKVQAARIKTHYKPVTLTILKDRLKKGQIPIFLISSYQITQTKTPHWVVVSGLDDQFIYLHDPDMDDDDLLFNEFDGVYIPVAHKQFIEMAKWGSKKLQAVLFLKKTIIKPVKRKLKAKPRPKPKPKPSRLRM
jgi:ribosomal protein S18 acetylase RimI-like enzyme